MAQTVKNLPEMLEIGVRYLGWEATLEEGMENHTPVFLRGESYG